MRRSDKQLTDPAAVEEILERGQVLHLGLSDRGEPYVVPLTYAWRGGVVWAHSAPEGRKLDVIRRNPRVCFEVTLDAEVVRNAGRPCDWTTRYRSVIGFGTARIVTEGPELREGLSALVEKHGGDAGELPARLGNVAVVRIQAGSISAKASER